MFFVQKKVVSRILVLLSFDTERNLSFLILGNFIKAKWL